MVDYAWAQDLALGHEELDADHRLLIGQFNLLHGATDRGEGRAVVGRLLAELMATTLAHVRREEDWMAELGYPRLGEHRQSHLRFVEELRFLQQRHQGGSLVVASELSTMLRDWLSLHIRRQDKDVLFYEQRLRRAGRGAPGSRAALPVHGAAGGAVPAWRASA